MTARSTRAEPTTVATLSQAPIFSGLSASDLGEIARSMRRQRFEAGDRLCRRGDQGDSLFVILTGLAHVLIDVTAGERQAPVARLRRGDVVGEMTLLTGEPRSATVIAIVPTDTLAMDRALFAAMLARYPLMLANLNLILSRRLARTNVLHSHNQPRGEAIVLLVEPWSEWLVPLIVRATSDTSPRAVSTLDLRPSVGGNLDALDDHLAEGATAIVVNTIADCSPALLETADRVLAITAGGGPRQLAELRDRLHDAGRSIDLALPRWDRAETNGPPGMPVIRRLIVEPRQQRISAETWPDVAWLGRHVARTKLGLALGAGGAKGYAHVAALRVLEEAGYTVDAVAGCSIGAMVGAWLALGRDANAIERIARESFTPEVVRAWFAISLAGTSTGVEVVKQICQKSSEYRTFSDLAIPLTVMCVDLNTQRPAPITDGSLWEALLAALSLAGLFPPFERDGQRLIDGLALVPVPVDSVVEAGADVTVAVNIMSRETLATWPDDPPPEPAPPKRVRMLDTLLEVMDLAQLDSSVRHAALADVTITPRFGPSTWRDFHLSDRFIAAGIEAARAQLPELGKLARPQRVPDL